MNKFREVNLPESPGRNLYEAQTGNDPTIHCYRFLAWDELSQESRDKWNAKAAPDAPSSQQAAGGSLGSLTDGQQQGYSFRGVDEVMKPANPYLNRGEAAILREGLAWRGRPPGVTPSVRILRVIEVSYGDPNKLGEPRAYYDAETGEHLASRS